MTRSSSTSGIENVVSVVYPSVTVNELLAMTPIALMKVFGHGSVSTMFVVTVLDSVFENELPLLSAIVRTTWVTEIVIEPSSTGLNERMCIFLPPSTPVRDYLI